MQAKITLDTNNRSLVVVRFRRQSHDDDQPEIEAIYQIFWPTDYTLMSNPIVIHLLSVTRTDSREPDRIVPTELPAIFNAVAIAVDKYDRSLTEGGP